ncbi:MAG: NAD(P)H-hydrate dehydratase [Methylophilales bacterium]|nr:NAD(P)H-hydrate dehydratase [Methylophilales bacterium]
MKTLYLSAQIRSIEPQYTGLMEKAGLAAAELAKNLAGNLPLLILAGPGNNGGDAFVAARYLKTWGLALDVLFTGDAAKLPPDAKAAYDAWSGKVLTEIPDKKYDLIVDGLFGIGLTRDLNVAYLELVNNINAMKLPVLALDVPSGLCADTGRILGAAIKATHTITFIGLKPGLFTLDGVDVAGEVHLADLGIPPSPSAGHLVDYLPYPLPARKNNSHKGSYGSVAVVGGSQGMVGAALLTAKSALLAGSGRVYCHLLATDAPLLDIDTPELMLRSVENIATDVNTLVIGMGMGHSAEAAKIISSCLQQHCPLVLDADALHLIASNDNIASTLKQRGNAVLTPHPGEAAALLHCDTTTIQADRIQSALNIAARYNAVTVLKGAGSIIATPGSLTNRARWFINHSGNPGLAAAGMGDVLAGIVGALLAQGLNTEQAALSGVYLHGLAADRLGIKVGLTASEVALEVRNILNSK